VIEIFDHHYGYEDFWEQRLGENSKIEIVGSCTTLIWEEYKKANLNSKISALAANLIYTATISNTLHLKASVTDDRDINTLKELEGYTDLPTNWDEMFFEAVESTLLKNSAQSMRNDTKHFEYNGKKFVIIQVELWDSKEFIDENREEIMSQLHVYEADYAFFSSPSISEGINYMHFSDQRSKELINSLVEIDFNEDLAKTKQLFLRKELIKLIRERV
jgi:inorganic pyrophosphatase/exopolyphosphatase